jgi:hypothetical protein
MCKINKIWLDLKSGIYFTYADNKNKKISNIAAYLKVHKKTWVFYLN